MFEFRKIIILIIFVPIFSAGINISSTRILIEVSPIGSWYFDTGEGNLIIDSSLNNNNGTTDAQWVDGFLGKGLLFNGVSSFAQINDNDIFDFQSAFTIQLWIKPYSFAGNGQTNGNTLVAKWVSNTIGQFQLSTFTGGMIAFSISNGSEYDIAYSKKSLIEYSWNMISAVYDGNTMCLYINSSLVSEKSTLIPSLYSSEYLDDFLRIGYGTSGDPPYWYFHGIIDEVNIYDIALNSDQVLSNYLEDQTIPINSKDSTFPTIPVNKEGISGSSTTSSKSEGSNLEISSASGWLIQSLVFPILVIAILRKSSQRNN